MASLAYFGNVTPIIKASGVKISVKPVEKESESEISSLRLGAEKFHKT